MADAAAAGAAAPSPAAAVAATTDGGFDSDDEAVLARPQAGGAHKQSTRCPYLDTINRHLLDFDMQKTCSVTLSPHNVYGCLVCGKFFGGRGKTSAAFTHALLAAHHVFINLHDGKVWCLPDAYEVTHASLGDIKYALNPTFSEAAVADLDRSTKLATDVLGVTYLPGFVGMNNLGHTDAVSAVVQALAHVNALRNYFLRPDNYAACGSRLVQSFGALVRKLWSPAGFKSTVTPIEFMVEVSNASAKRFHVGTAMEAADLLMWLLNTLHADLTAEDAGSKAAAAAAGATAAAASGGAAASSSSCSSSSSSSSDPAAAGASGGAVSGVKRPRPAAASGKAGAGAAAPSSSSAHLASIITRCFQGEVEVVTLSSELEEELMRETEKATSSGGGSGGAKGPGGSSGGGGAGKPAAGAAGAAAREPAAKRRATAAAGAAGASAFPKTQRVPFLCLSLDLPPAPLYAGEGGGVSLPQVPLFTLLEKYNGEFVTESLRGQYRERKRYRITRLPPYVIMTVRRFARNAFFVEKNQTIVTFPVRNLDFKPCLAPEAVATPRDAAGKPLPALEDVPSLPVAELKALAARAGATAAVERSELVTAATAAVAAATPVTRYDLVANVVHDSPPSAERGSEAANPLVSGSYRAHVHHEGTGQWYEIQDLHVQETLPEAISISQTYVLVVRRQRVAAGAGGARAGAGAVAAAAGGGGGY